MTDSPSTGWEEICEVMGVDPQQHERHISDVDQRAVGALADIRQTHLEQRFFEPVVRPEAEQ